MFQLPNPSAPFDHDSAGVPSCRWCWPSSSGGSACSRNRSGEAGKSIKPESKLDNEAAAHAARSRIGTRHRPPASWQARGGQGTTEQRAGSSKVDLSSIGAFTAEAMLANSPLSRPILTSTASRPTPPSGAGEVAAGTDATDTLLEILGTDDTNLTGDRVGIAVIDSGLDNDEDFEHSGRTSSGTSSARPTTSRSTTTVTARTSPVSSPGREAFAGEGPWQLEGAPPRLLPGHRPEGADLQLQGSRPIRAGYTSAVIQALEFITANKDRLKIRIVNLIAGAPGSGWPRPTRSSWRSKQPAEGIDRGGVRRNYGRHPRDRRDRLRRDHLRQRAVGDHGRHASTHNTITREDDSIPGYSSRGPTMRRPGEGPGRSGPRHRRAGGPRRLALPRLPAAACATGMASRNTSVSVARAWRRPPSCIALMLEQQYAVSRECLTPTPSRRCCSSPRCQSPVMTPSPRAAAR